MGRGGGEVEAGEGAGASAEAATEVGGGWEAEAAAGDLSGLCRGGKGGGGRLGLREEAEAGGG